jgi:hypothetical protein
MQKQHNYLLFNVLPLLFNIVSKVWWLPHITFYSASFSLISQFYFLPLVSGGEGCRSFFSSYTKEGEPKLFTSPSSFSSTNPPSTTSRIFYWEGVETPNEVTSRMKETNIYDFFGWRMWVSIWSFLFHFLLILMDFESNGFLLIWWTSFICMYPFFFHILLIKSFKYVAIWDGRAFLRYFYKIISLGLLLCVPSRWLFKVIMFIIALGNEALLQKVLCSLGFWASFCKTSIFMEIVTLEGDFLILNGLNMTPTLHIDLNHLQQTPF